MIAVTICWVYSIYRERLNAERERMVGRYKNGDML